MTSNLPFYSIERLGYLAEYLVGWSRISKERERSDRCQRAL